MVDGSADGRTWIKGASRGEWKSETAGIDKTAVPLFSPIDLWTWLRKMDCCPGDLMLLHKAGFCLRDVSRQHLFFIQLISYSGS